MRQTFIIVVSPIIFSYLLYGPSGATPVPAAPVPGISPFDILNMIGFSFVFGSYAAIIFRKRIGRSWLRLHYNAMLNSIAFLVIAAINQVLPRVGISYLIWVFYLLCLTSFFILPRYVRRLDQRYNQQAQRPATPTIAPPTPT